MFFLRICGAVCSSAGGLEFELYNSLLLTPIKMFYIKAEAYQNSSKCTKDQSIK